MKLVPVRDGKVARPLRDAADGSNGQGREGAARWPAGVLLEHAEGWAASMPAFEWYDEGPAEESPLSGGRLPPGLWVTNFAEAAGEAAGVRIRLSGFYRSTLDELCDDWGVARQSRPSRADVERLAAALQRTLVAVAEAGHSLLDDPPDWQPAGEEWTDWRVTEKPSLSTSILGLVRPGLPSDPDEGQGMGEFVENAFIRGIASGRLEKEEPLFLASVPGLRHARVVLEKDVPEEGEWATAEMEEGDSADSFLAAIGKLVEERQWPAMIFGHPVGARPGPETGMMTGVYKGREPRLCVIDEEFAAFGARYRPEGIAIGKGGWRRSPFLDLLDRLEACSASQHLVGNYWCVQLAAENILCAALRRIEMKRLQAGPSIAALWYGSRDRIAMQPFWEGLIDAGAEPVHGYAGRIRFRAPADPEVMGRIAATAWESGLLLSMSTSWAFRRAGATLPDRNKESWGGKRSDRLYAALVYRGNIAGLERFDSIRSLPAERRIEAWQQQMSGKPPAEE